MDDDVQPQPQPRRINPKVRLIERVFLRYIAQHPGCKTSELGQFYHLRVYNRTDEDGPRQRRSWAGRVVDKLATRRLVNTTLHLDLTEEHKVAGGRYLTITITSRGQRMIRSAMTPEEVRALAGLGAPPEPPEPPRAAERPTKKKENKQMPNATKVTEAIETVLNDAWIASAKDSMDEEDMHELIALKASKLAGAEVTRDQVHLHLNPPPPPPPADVTGPSLTDLAAEGVPETAEEALRALVGAIARLADSVRQLADNTTKQLDGMREALELMALTPCHERQATKPESKAAVKEPDQADEPAASEPAPPATPAAASATSPSIGGPGPAYQAARIVGALPGRD